MTFELERASIGSFFGEEDPNKIIEKMNLPKGYEVQINMNNAVFNLPSAKQIVDPIVYIKINSLEQLLMFSHDVHADLVVSDCKITIYDGYLE